MTKIEWTDESWSPVVGCTKVSAGCENCYAEKMAARLAAMYRKDSIKYKHLRKYDYVITNGKWNGKIFCDESALDKPLHWKKPRMIFVESMGDLFHPSIPFEFVRKVFIIMYSTGKHIYQLLTKRPERALEFWNWFRENNHVGGKTYDLADLNNIWFGWTAENQPMMDLRTPIGLQIPAAVLFVSIEPMLEDMSLNMWVSESESLIDWVIVGCESGHGARYCPEKNIRNVVTQCKDAGVPIFVKQMHIYGMDWRMNKAIKDVNLFPKDLQVREYPKGADENAGNE